MEPFDENFQQFLVWDFKAILIVFAKEQIVVLGAQERQNFFESKTNSVLVCAFQNQMNSSQVSQYPSAADSVPYLPSVGDDLSRSMASMYSAQSVQSIHNISYESTI